MNSSLILLKDSLPHFGDVDGFKCKQIFPHPPNNFHFAVSPPVQKFEDLHFVLQKVVDHCKIDLPFAYGSIRQNYALSDELT
jgi:hypothetical protein